MTTAADAHWLEGLEEAARAVLPVEVHDYIRTGSGAGTTVAEATAAWQEVRFTPRVLRDVSEVDLAVDVLGTLLRAPIAVAPTTLQRMAHPEGELAMARGCAAAGSLMVVSSNAGTPFRAVGETGAAWWLQAYLTQDRSLCDPLLAEAVASGARAVVLTVDTPVVAAKRGAAHDVWASVPDGVLRANFGDATDHLPGSAKATDLSPADIRWLRESTGLPVVVKGVMHPDDARRCVDAGASAVWVSNHGGRQLDRSVPTARALPRVAAAVGDQAEVYVDGGLRSGLDILAALATGARCAFLGRLPVWALVSGDEGVSRLHSILTAELTESLRLAGVERAREAARALSE